MMMNILLLDAWIGTFQPAEARKAGCDDCAKPKIQATAGSVRILTRGDGTPPPQGDVVIDCSDNFATRQAINRACFRHGKPLVAGAAIRFDAQISVYDPRDAASPCYACVFPPSDEFEETRCATLGVFAPLVGIIGAMQAAEALKILAQTGESLAGRLQMLDARAMAWSEVRVPRNASCEVCAPLRA